ncbi:MAG: hypothetical protein IPN53_03235 [Comamonadaceae bacterium]|nr:hypothetical protein [Comamonadaceae bacterium]
MKSLPGCFFVTPAGKPNITLVPNVKLIQAQVDALDHNFDVTSSRVEQ